MWKRSWFRWTVRCVALLLLAIFSATFYYRWRGENELAEARKEFTEKVGSLDPKAYEPKPIKDEDNGAVWLLAGSQAVVVFHPEAKVLHLLADTPSPLWKTEQVELAKRLLERNAPALTLLYRSQGMPVCDLEAALSGKEGPSLKFIWAARLLAVDSRDALRQSDTERFLRAAEALRALASSLERTPDSVSLIVGQSLERQLLAVIQEGAVSPNLAKDSTAKFEALLPDVDLMEAWRRTIGKMAADMEARMTAGTEEDYLGVQPGWGYKLYDWTLGDLDQAGYLQMWPRALSWAREPYALRPPSPPTPPKIGPWRIIGDIQAPNLWGIVGRGQATLALREMTRLGLEIRKDGLEKGSYPSDLAAFPRAKTPDPFTGKPLVYTLHADGSAGLAVSNADALWKRVTQGMIPSISFSWTLPPLSPVPPARGLARTRPA